MDRHTKTIKIIPAGPKHVELIAPLFDAYRQFYRRPPDLHGARVFITERLNKKESVLFLALGDGDSSSTAVGFVHLYPTFSSLSMKPLWALSDLFVVREARKQGVAKALMERARQLAVGTHSEGLILETATDNYPAQKLYEHLGYKRDDEFYRYYLRV